SHVLLTATPETSTLSLHDALPIFGGGARRALPADQQQVVRSSEARESLQQQRQVFFAGEAAGEDQHARVRRQSEPRTQRRRAPRSEEHTSELQSHLNLVCRLLLEK